LLELLIVMALVGILATLAMPSYRHSVVKAREAALLQDLFTMRDVLDQYRADKGKYPPALAALLDEGYLKRLPVDPFTNSSESWQELTEPTEGGVSDVHSGSKLVALNGTPYNTW
jgi:general secretion pathway protein G